MGPSSLTSRTKFCTGADESSDSMLPTTGLVGGRGIGLNLLEDAIAKLSPAYPNLFLRHSISLALTSPGFSCCVQWPLSLTRYFSRSGTSFSMPSAADGGSTASFSAMIISDGTRTVWSSPSARCQLRVQLRYQLMPPVKPVLVKVSTNTFFSSADRIGVRGSCLAS